VAARHARARRRVSLAAASSRTAAAAGALLAALCVPLWSPISVGTAEVPLAFAIALAGTAFLDWLERPSGAVLARLLIAAVLCAGTKQEGIAFCVFLAAALVFRRGARLRLAGAAALLVPAAVSFWASRALVRGAAHADFDLSLLAPSRWVDLAQRLRDVGVHLVGAEIADAWPLAAGLALVLLLAAPSFADALIAPLILQAVGYTLIAAASPDPIARLDSTFGRVAALWPAAVVVLVARASATLGARREPRRALVAALAGSALALAVVVPFAFGSRLRAAGPVTVAGLARPTFHATVEPILQARCQSCHRDGGIAPIPLVRYREAEEHAAQVARMVDSRRMPPWKAAAGPHAFANDPTLSWAEREAIVRWARRGAPEGRASHAPPPRRFAQGWELGEPDLVLKAPRFHARLLEGRPLPVLRAPDEPRPERVGVGGRGAPRKRRDDASRAALRGGGRDVAEAGRGRGRAGLPVLRRPARARHGLVRRVGARDAGAALSAGRRALPAARVARDHAGPLQRALRRREAGRVRGRRLFREGAGNAAPPLRRRPLVRAVHAGRGRPRLAPDRDARPAGFALGARRDPPRTCTCSGAR
jgi:hypothetical protein